MLVTLVSQCEKKALKRTRRVLDAFANRIGDNTWQTVITQEGLLATKKLLRKTASKNTAVACHWIRSRSRSDLVWVVGNKGKFNEQGVVPVNSTKTNRACRDDLADWHYLPLIQSLAALAALLHDWGKANARFQQKLSRDYKGRCYVDALRHEWISCLLLKALIGADTTSDHGWLSLLSHGEIDEARLTGTDLSHIKKPLAELPPIAKLVAWLILTHHRLPLQREKKNELANKHSGKPADSMDKLLELLDADWGYRNRLDNWESQIEDCLRFPEGLLCNSPLWLKELKRWSKKLLDQRTAIDTLYANGSHRLVLHHARLCLMLGDHYYSSLDLNQSGYWRRTANLIANTQEDDRTPKQALDQHLIGVCRQAQQNAYRLPQFERQLPETTNTAPLRKKSQGKFAWQDTPFKKISAWKKAAQDNKQGFFAVNMASTGCGKTIVNAKVMLALSEDDDSLRYILALGLRTLTLQTGTEYRDRIFRHVDGSGADGSELAVLIGSRSITELHGHGSDQKQEHHPEKWGSESEQTLLDDSDQVLYQDDVPEEGLATLLREEKDRQFLYAPVLVCTIDHIMAATETTRGGRYILPCLRLMSSDLVIDEVDDFSGSDTIAIGRLIHLAGMLGRKVMISSATIPPALAEGYFRCYREGWQLFVNTRSASPNIACAWIDEFNTQIRDINGEKADQQYASQHTRFIDKRVERLSKQAAKRKANIVDCQSVLDSTDTGDNNLTSKQSAWFATISQEALLKHRTHHYCDNSTGLAVSFGVIRIANIVPCVALTRALLDNGWPDDTEVRVLAYHSQQVLLLRHTQEQHLDAVLKRKEPTGQEPAALQNPVIRRHLDSIAGERQAVNNVLFILVATPVEEIGRDHDFDWAIVEPSSYRAIIQLAGRVRRHRDGEVAQPNIALLQYNWLTVRRGEAAKKARFCRPGFESEKPLSNGNMPCFPTHDLSQLLDTAAIGQKLDAIPRIRQTPDTPRFARLEHAVIADQLNNTELKGPDSLQGYLTEQWYLTALPQQFHRFRQSEAKLRLYRATDSSRDIVFWERDSQGRLIRDEDNDPMNQAEVHRIQTTELSDLQQRRLWLTRDYLTRAARDYEELVLRYGELVLREQQSSDLFYNDQLGLFEEQRDKYVQS